MPSVPERINIHISEAGCAICDACIQFALGLPSLQQVQEISGALGTTRDFKRDVGFCGMCHERAEIIRS
jgi:hypothetical protein